VQPGLSDLERRLWLPYAVGMIGANVIGAAIIFIFIRFVLPLPSVHDADRVATTNLLIFVGYLAVAVPVGVVWVLRFLRPVRAWLRSGAPADELQQREVLLIPARELVVHAVLWFIGGAGFVLYNLHYSRDLAVIVAIAAFLGACGTCLFAYLLAQHIVRPVAVRALAHTVPERPPLPGITTRVLLTWGLGTGVPVLGLVITAAGMLVGQLDASANRMAAAAVFLGSVSLVVGGLVMGLTARSLSGPLGALRAALSRVRAGRTDVHVAVDDGSELGLVQAGFNQMVAGLAERERLRDLFGRQVGEEVALQALERGIVLGGEELEVTALFIDLVGSTELAHARPPTEVVDVLNGFFDIVVGAVAAQDGTVNKFVGDAALCVFGAPLEHPDAATAALRAARLMLAELNERMPRCDVGIGVSAGTVVAGNIGAAERFEYTVIGDPVNEAARLTELAKQHAGRILASGAVLERASVAEREHWALGASEQLRGRATATQLVVQRFEADQRSSAASGRPQSSSDGGGGTL
jgi:adenylate cyclase